METQENSKDKQALKGREDKREHNIDANMSISEMRKANEQSEKENKKDDAQKYKEDRGNGNFSPKSI